jgi:hypothetical protein
MTTVRVRFRGTPAELDLIVGRAREALGSEGIVAELATWAPPERELAVTVFAAADEVEAMKRVQGLVREADAYEHLSGGDLIQTHLIPPPAGTPASLAA